MKKISLMGQRSNRTPLSYPEYRKLFQNNFEYLHNPEDADYLVFSCLMDMHNNVDEIDRILTLRPDIQLVILSEEPLWDTVYSDNFVLKRRRFSVGERDYPCVFLNHYTTKIFDFEKIPYFLTTSDDYFARYSFLFARNCGLKADQLKALWATAPIRVAFYAEYRDEVIFDAHFPEQDVLALSRYRTLLAKAVKGDGVIRVGRGWGTKIVRQLLPDWHLDKLATLDSNCFIVSGIENTHQWNYISEKIFDAFAVLAVPLYLGSRKHGIERIVPAESFINLHELSVDQAAEKISSFRQDKGFLDQYRLAQSRLAEFFSQPMSLVKERTRVVTELISEFDAL
jgi:hypothetical protein